MVRISSTTIDTGTPTRRMRLRARHRAVVASGLVATVVLCAPAVRPALAGGRATIAVLPFELAGPIVSGPRLETDVLTDTFSRVLVGTGKFAVVDRARLERVRREQKFGGSGLVDGATAARVGRILGADYLVVGQVLDYSAELPKEMAYGSGWTRPVRISVEVQVVDASSAQIVSAKRAAATAQVRVSSPQAAGGIPRAALEKAAEEVATETLDAIVSSAFPLRVVDVSGDTVRLNRGADGALEVGDVLRCFARGKALIDPDTKESLGFRESESGRVRIVEVLPKLTVAEIVDEGSIHEGDTCRTDDATASEPGRHRAAPPPGPIHAY